jgi:DNA polymerase-3 subunit chi
MALDCRVEFRTGVPEPQAYALALVRKAWRQGAALLLLADDPVLQALDRALWLGPEREFLPHARVGEAPAAVLRRSPVWLAPDVVAAQAAGVACPAVAVGVDAVWPEGAALEQALAPLQRVIQVVGADPQAVARGRVQWRAFKALQAPGLHLAHASPTGGES